MWNETFHNYIYWFIDVQITLMLQLLLILPFHLIYNNAGNH